MKLYLVAFIRNHSIETVVKLTKSITTAQLALINTIKNCEIDNSSEYAKEILADFSSGLLSSNVNIFIDSGPDGPLYLQLYAWDEAIS